MGFLVDSELNVSQQCTLVAVKANRMLGCIQESVVSRTRTAIIRLSSVLVRLHLGGLFPVGLPSIVTPEEY